MKEMVQMAVGTTKVMVKGKNLDVTPALRAHAEKRAAKLSKFFAEDQELLIEVVMGVQRELDLAEITLRVGGIVIRGEGKTSDMYVSIDEGFDSIERQLRKYKTRIQKRKQGPKLSETFTNSEFMVSTEDAELPKVVRTKRFALKPMSIEEAVMQMELLGHDFFVFTNASTNEVNVLYKRKDNNYGLIEPES